jgi:hypothetical protein
VGRRLLDLVHDEDRAAFVRLLTGSRGGEHAISLRMGHADGRELVVEGTLRDLRHDTAVACWVLTVRDVTERTRLEEALTHQAFHDSLTSLANRQLFSDRPSHALHRPGTGGSSLLFIDLDDFKLVNDGLGHGVGDLLLIEVAGRISGVELVEQARWLHTHGSPQGQGFLWSRPVGLESAKVLLRAGLPEVLEPAGLRLVPPADAVRLAE